MYQEKINEIWTKESIFPCTGTKKSDGGYFAYFCHLLYNGQHSHKVVVEENEPNSWSAFIEYGDGEMYHRMSTEYTNSDEAFTDAIGWVVGQ